MASLDGDPHPLLLARRLRLIHLFVPAARGRVLLMGAGVDTFMGTNGGDEIDIVGRRAGGAADAAGLGNDQGGAAKGVGGFDGGWAEGETWGAGGRTRASACSQNSG